MSRFLRHPTKTGKIEMNSIRNFLKDGVAKSAGEERTARSEQKNKEQMFEEDLLTCREAWRLETDRPEDRDEFGFTGDFFEGLRQPR